MSITIEKFRNEADKRWKNDIELDGEEKHLESEKWAVQQTNDDSKD